MIKPNVLIMSGYGLNCEEETKYAFDLAGAKADIIHINDLIDSIKKLNDYQIVTFPGGFSYGDDTGSGNAFANKVRNHLWEKITRFARQDKLVMGICNGFQILVRLGLLPANIALTNNDSARYTVRWVDVKVENSSPWLSGLDNITLPIAHGEGKIVGEVTQNFIALRYVAGEICSYQNLPANPNGSLDDIAGVTDETGRIFGLMPHPERATFFTQLPHWTYLKEQYRRHNKPVPRHGPGISIFQNAVQYFL